MAEPTASPSVSSAPTGHTADSLPHRANEERVHLSAYRPPAWRAPTLNLTFDLEPNATRVVAEATYECATPGQPLRLDGEGLVLEALRIDGEPLDLETLTFEGSQLVLDPGKRDRFVIRCETRLDPEQNKTLAGLYRSSGIYCTQMEAAGFRRVTYWQDRPDVLSRYTCTVRADKDACPVLLSNGNIVAERELENGRHEAVWEDPHLKPCYLFALVAGRLDVLEDSFTTASGRKVALKIWVDPGQVSRATHAMASLKASMAWDEAVYGREYDLDLFQIVAIEDFNMGAMENKGLNVFNSALVLCDPATATDDDAARIEGVVAHEYFHNWTGNRVTCRDWFQLSLKEGLTVYRDQCFSGDMNDPAVQRISDVRMLREAQFAEDASPLAHPVRPSTFVKVDNFYTATVYEKGAEIIRMQATRLGKERFRAGTDLYFERHDGQAVTLEDWIAALSDGSGVDLGEFFRWYDQKGTPRLRVSMRWEDTTLALDFEQRAPSVVAAGEARPVPIPIALGFIDAAGQEASFKSQHPALDGHIFTLRDWSDTLRIEGLSRGAAPSLLRGFSAPVLLEADLPTDLKVTLAKHDSDAFNRWDALQQLATVALTAVVADGDADAAAAARAGVLEAIGAVLADVAAGRSSRLWAAEALRLPSEKQLNESLDVYAIAEIHAARQDLLETMARDFAGPIEALAQTLRGDVAASGAEGRGARALLNVLVSLGVTGGARWAIDYAAAAAKEGATMTERLGGLIALLPLRQTAQASLLDAANADFRATFANETLVLNKWFSVQAVDRSTDAARIRELAADPAFDRQNPNRIRALYGAFTRNLAGFHHESGSGYALLAEVIREVDAFNPIMASRLATTFSVLPRLPEASATQVRKAVEPLLEAAASGPALSANLKEVLTQVLA